jgi:Domain of unknown function (DUF4352)
VSQQSMPQAPEAAQPAAQADIPAAPKQKSWFRRHKILTAVLAIIAVIVISSVAGGGSDTATPTAGTDSSTAAAGQAPAQEPAPEPAPEEKVAEIGTPVRDGKFEFVVEKIAYSTKSVGNEFLNKAPQGQFAIVTVSVKNIGDEPQTLFAENQYLFVGDKKYSADTEAATYASDNGDMWLTEINPGNSVSGPVYFDIPKGAKAGQLELHDSAFSGGVDVNVG